MRAPRNVPWRALCGYGLSAVAFVFAGLNAGLNRKAFALSVQQIAPMSLCLAVAAFALQICINAIAFSCLNHAFGVSIGGSRLALTWTRTLLAKYIPGGVWHVASRGVLLAQLGVPGRTTLAVAMVEQLVSLGLCGLICGWLFLIFLEWSRWGFALAIACTLALITLPPYVCLWLRHPMRADIFRWAFLAYASAMIPFALGYLFVINPDASAQFLSALFAGTVAGVLALPVPGGLGIRESVTAAVAMSSKPEQLLAGMIAARALIFGVEVTASVLSLRAGRAEHAP